MRDVLLATGAIRARKVELRDEPRDRRAQLVRGIRDEARLAVLRRLETR